ncbi:hypothetical protein PR202_ga25884 [Eleusine coracana subsp. coracana]|uniref:CWF21 domain-containing protein n=1 Tax=Eleusine coracana subsp. coracana TaxID=191504 RepID=A0AAV5DC76_ELECO|nr:hypothetical protein PR202_ga25884 [Eleusine coracana subsp. coracana]
MRTGEGRSVDSGSAEHELVLSKKPKYDPVLPDSKWSRDDDISDDEDRKGGRGLGLSYSSGSDTAGDLGKVDTTEVSTDQATHRPDTIVDEEQRQKLRQIEISVMQYRESLEEQGLRNVDEIERKVASHRRRLQSEYGLSISTDGTNSRRSSERKSLEQKERLDDAHDYPRKRRRSQSRSRSPPRKSQEREREHGRNRDRDRSHGNDAGRERRSGEGNEGACCPSEKQLGSFLEGMGSKITVSTVCPRRFLYRNTFGRFKTEKDLLNDAEQSMMEYRSSIEKLKKDSKYTLDKIAIGESDLQRGQTDLRSSGKQIQSLIGSIYKAETTAAGGFNGLRFEIPEMRLAGKDQQNI